MGDEQPLKSSIDLANLVRDMLDGETREVRGFAGFGLKEIIERQGDRILIKEPGLFYNSLEGECIIKDNGDIEVYLGERGLFGRFGQTPDRVIYNKGDRFEVHSGDSNCFKRFVNGPKETIVQGEDSTKAYDGKQRAFEFLNPPKEEQVREGNRTETYTRPPNILFDRFFQSPDSETLHGENKDKKYSGIPGAFGIPSEVTNIKRPPKPEPVPEEIEPEQAKSESTERNYARSPPYSPPFDFNKKSPQNSNSHSFPIEQISSVTGKTLYVTPRGRASYSIHVQDDYVPPADFYNSPDGRTSKSRPKKEGEVDFVLC